MTFYWHLSSRAFLEIRNTAECSSTAFLCFGDRPSSWPAKTDHQSWPFHQACCCPGSLQCIMRRKSHYLLLTKKLFHNTESFERVSLYLCLQSRLKYVALHNLTRWQFASMYFFYFHCWILCTLCSEELGIEITVREILLSIEKNGGGEAWMLCAHEGSVICLCRAAEFAGGPCPIARAAGALVWIHAEKCGTLVLRTVIQVCRIQSRSVLWWVERSCKSRVCNGFFSC